MRLSKENSRLTFYSDEVLENVGMRFEKTLLSLELRSCRNLTDDGIMQMCEGLSEIGRAHV
jgi:hypothetical protein